MTTVPFPKKFGNAKHLSDGDCLDCHAPASVYVMAVDEGRSETIVVHGGAACSGFVTRFTPGDDNPHGPTPSPACDEQGNQYARPQSQEAPAKSERRRLPEVK